MGRSIETEVGETVVLRASNATASESKATRRVDSGDIDLWEDDREFAGIDGLLYSLSPLPFRSLTPVLSSSRIPDMKRLLKLI